MLSLIEVKCPHCGAQGQIMLPPLGAIIIGPCPECEGMVVVFCGRVLPLDKDIMTNGGVEAKTEHLMEVLSNFLQERVERLFKQAAAAEPHDEAAPGLEEELLRDTEPLALHDAEIMQSPQKHAVPISEDEIESFINIDLKLLDNKEYFKAVFE